MKIVTKEKFKALAERNGWSLDHAKGYVDGEFFRQRDKPPSKHVLVGIDEYSQGFRAGYFERHNTVSGSSFPRPFVASR